MRLSLKSDGSTENVRCSRPGLISCSVPLPVPSKSRYGAIPNKLLDTCQFRTTHGINTKQNTARHKPHFTRHRRPNDTPTYTSNGTSTDANAYSVNVPIPTASAPTINALFTQAPDLPASCHFSAFSTP